MRLLQAAACIEKWAMNLDCSCIIYILYICSQNSACKRYIWSLRIISQSPDKMCRESFMLKNILHALKNCDVSQQSFKLSKQNVSIFYYTGRVLRYTQAIAWLVNSRSEASIGCTFGFRGAFIYFIYLLSNALQDCTDHTQNIKMNIATPKVYQWLALIAIPIYLLTYVQ